MDFQRYDLLILDFDGTIGKLDVDWAALRSALHNHFLEKHNMDIDFTSYSGGASTVYERLGEVGKKEFNEIAYQFESQGVNGFKENEKCKSIMKEFLGPQVVWSSNQSSVIREVLQKFAIGKRIGLIVGKDQVNFTKPNSEGFLIIRRYFDTAIPKILFIGNSTSDENAAKNLGIDYIDIRKIKKQG